MATWHTVESARDEWVDAPTDEDDGDNILTSLLAVAKSAVLAYGPAADVGGLVVDADGYLVQADPDSAIPEQYRMAQLMQARNVWNSNNASPGGFTDGESYGLSTFPLDWQIRQLLRPKRGVPVIA